ncbi:MAG TPA: metallophosphoesterase [Gammaproteobacteria bacterium]|nr:metallophosphoesterase [Gammaproteobacteria bacterium]
MYANPGTLRWISSLLLAGLLALLTACQGGSDGDSAAADGQVVIGLTDGEGDFASYTVDVLSLTLTRANGSVVETLPVQTRIDFAQYTDMTEFVTAATIPSGAYVKAVMTVDYSNADIQVENAAGDIVPVPLDHILDEDGNAVTTLDLSVRLEGRKRLVIVPGVPAHLTLDFDLAASNRVSFDDQGIPTQVVSPVLFADVELNKPKAHRLRGLLDEVAPDQDRFTVVMRPFRHLLSVRDRHFGTLEVETGESTLFEVDGTSYQGHEGLLALDNLSPLSAVVVVGDILRRPHRFKAREVYAGSSVPGGTLDVVRGNVVKRETTAAGEVLTVRGATLIRRDGSIRFNGQTRVLISDTTRVTRQLSMESFSIADISIGQRVMIYGQWLDQPTDLYALDASNGHVRMMLTTLRGRVADPAVSGAGYLSLGLQTIDRRPVTLFDFTGTGIDPDHDADPAAYELDTTTLDIAAYTPATPLMARGFVRPYGQAPADFEARTLMAVGALPASLAVNWVPPTGDAFLSLSGDGMTLNLTGSGRFHHVRQGGVVFDLSQGSGDPVILPTADGEGHYLLRQGHRVVLHTRFDRLVADLQSRLDGGATVAWMRGRGSYDANATSLTAEELRIILR